MSLSRFAVLSLAGLTLSACSTVSVPKIDFIKVPEFREEAENIGDYPQVSEAPAAPTDVRSASEWDDAARRMEQVRADFNAPLEAERPKSDAAVAREVDALKNQVRAYKLDDPQ